MAFREMFGTGACGRNNDQFTQNPYEKKQLVAEIGFFRLENFAESYFNGNCQQSKIMYNR